MYEYDKSFRRTPGVATCIYNAVSTCYDLNRNDNVVLEAHGNSDVIMKQHEPLAFLCQCFVGFIPSTANTSRN